MMICLILVSSLLGILKSCKNGYERLENRKLRSFERWSDRGSEKKFFDSKRSKPVVLSSGHEIPSKLWRNIGRQSATHHDGNRILNPYNMYTNGIKRIKPWGKPTRWSGDTYGERWPEYKNHYSSALQDMDMEAEHVGLPKAGFLRKLHGFRLGRGRPRGNDGEERNYPSKPETYFSSLNYQDKEIDKSALGELVGEIGREIDLISAGDINKPGEENRGLISKVIQWIEQIKLVIIAFGIF